MRKKDINYHGNKKESYLIEKGIFSVTEQGLKAAETLFGNIDSKQCFVAMWFEIGRAHV